MTAATSALRAVEGRRRLVRLFQGDSGLMTAAGLLNSPTVDGDFVSAIAEAHERALTHATLFVADDSLVSLIDSAAPTMPDQPLRLTDVPTGANFGLVWFDTLLPDRSGTQPVVDLQALSWQFLAEGHALLREGRGSSLLLTVYVRTVDLAAATRVTVPVGAPALSVISTVIWEVGTLIGTVHGEAPSRTDVVPGFFQRVAAAFWTLLQQPRVTDQSQQQPLSQRERRRHRRTGVVEPGAPVHIVRVKGTGSNSPSADYPGSSGRRLQHRHVVRGHWRAHWFPSLEEHRHIWIDSHIKGPTDAPLIGGERVFLASPPGDRH